MIVAPTEDLEPLAFSIFGYALRYGYSSSQASSQQYLQWICHNGWPSALKGGNGLPLFKTGCANLHRYCLYHSSQLHKHHENDFTRLIEVLKTAVRDCCPIILGATHVETTTDLHLVRVVDKIFCIRFVNVRKAGLRICHILCNSLCTQATCSYKIQNIMIISGYCPSKYNLNQGSFCTTYLPRLFPPNLVLSGC